MSQLKGKVAIVTGSSRGVGADTAKILASQGVAVVVNYRDKAPRAKKVVKAIEETGGQAVAVQADLTSSEDREALVAAAKDNFGGLDLLVLNASGGMETDRGEDYAMALNRDAQVGMLDAAFKDIRPGGRVIFVTSNQAHFVETHPTLPAYEMVARSKRAGETALRSRAEEFTDVDVKFIVVSGDMIEGTITATLLDRVEPGAIEQRRAQAGRLYSVAEFAEEVARMASEDVEHMHTELVGGAHGFID